METGGWNEGGKNRWRYKEGSEEKIIEIELAQGKITSIDADRLPDILPYRWYAAKGDSRIHELFYVKANYRDVSGKKSIMCMHRFLFPDIVPPRDHIDRNGLNNTRANIRSGSHGINCRNKASKKRDIGVTEYPDERVTRARWREANSRIQIRSFFWSDYQSSEEAYQAAAACRKHENDRAMAEIAAAQLVNPHYVRERVSGPPQTNKTGRKYVQSKQIGNRSFAVGRVIINGKIHTKTFNANLFSGDIEKAADAAHEWAKNTRQTVKGKKRERDE